MHVEAEEHKEAKETNFASHQEIDSEIQNLLQLLQFQLAVYLPFCTHHHTYVRFAVCHASHQKEDYLFASFDNACYFVVT